MNAALLAFFSIFCFFLSYLFYSRFLGKKIYKLDSNIITPAHEFKDGIDYCKDLNIKMHNNSVNLIKENQGYSWSKDKEGNVLDEPVKFKDHLMDARRYAYYTHRKRVLKNVKTAITVKDYAVNWEV